MFMSTEMLFHCCSDLSLFKRVSCAVSMVFVASMRSSRTDFFLIEEIKIHIAGIDALAQGRDDGALLFDDAGEVGGVAADCRICLHECRQFVFNLRVNSLALTRDLFFDGT